MRQLILQGTVDRVDPEGKFGFIIGPNGEEYFFQQAALPGPEFGALGPGVAVEFDISTEAGDRPDEHLRAVDIHLAPDAIPTEENEPLPPEKISGQSGANPYSRSTHATPPDSDMADPWQLL